MRGRKELQQTEIKQEIELAKKEVEELGGVRTFRSGEWLLKLIHSSLRSSSRRTAQERWRMPADTMCRRLGKIAARRAAIAGALAGTAVSADEVIAFLTAGEAGVGLPANIAIAAGAILAEVFFVTRLQIQLVADIANVCGTPLDADRPEDIITVFSLATGGTGAELKDISDFHEYLRGELAGRLKAVAKKIGLKRLKRSALNASVPFASILMSAAANYRNTKAIGKAAWRQFSRQQEPRMVVVAESSRSR